MAKSIAEAKAGSKIPDQISKTYIGKFNKAIDQLKATREELEKHMDIKRLKIKVGIANQLLEDCKKDKAAWSLVYKGDYPPDKT